jgi:hypothetical protein
MLWGGVKRGAHPVHEVIVHVAWAGGGPQRSIACECAEGTGRGPLRYSAKKPANIPFHCGRRRPAAGRATERGGVAALTRMGQMNQMMMMTMVASSSSASAAAKVRACECARVYVCGCVGVCVCVCAHSKEEGRGLQLGSK